MTSKAYIVANEEQERNFLERFEKEGYSWNDTENTPPTEWHPGGYPYAIFVKDGKKLVWSFSVNVSEVEIVAEDKQDKFKISKEAYDALVEWRDEYILNAALGRWAECVDGSDLSEVPEVVINWWVDKEMPIESNNRLIAIIRWVNGEDVFEVEKPKKWVVRSKDSSEAGKNLYVMLDISHGVKKTIDFWDKDIATRFDTKEEAQSWANAHQEVVQVEM